MVSVEDDAGFVRKAARLSAVMKQMKGVESLF